MPVVRRFPVLAVVVAVTLSLALEFHHASAQGRRTTADRVFDAEQARRGLGVYDDKCASCHDGGNMGPELWGTAFLQEWRQRDVAALYTVILETMPQEAAGTLSEAETLQTIAYVLQQNGYPAGDKPLQSRNDLVGMAFADRN